MKIIYFFCIFLSIHSYSVESIRILSSPKDALQARVDLIQQAQEEILLCYFIFKDDEIGLPLLSLLKQASQKNIQIKMILDANFSKISNKYLKVLKDYGVFLEINNSEFAYQLNQSMSENIGFSLKVLKNGNLETTDERYPKTNFFKKVLTDISRLTIVPIFKGHL